MLASTEIILNKVLGTWAFVLVVLGTFGNSFCVYTCMRPKLRKTPTFLFLSFIAITDTISLYGWNFNHFFQAYWEFVMEDAGKFVCRLNTFYQCFSLEASAWFLVSMCLERYFCARITTWRKTYFNWRHALTLSFIILLFFMLLNSHLFFTLDYNNDFKNTTTLVGVCFTSEMWILWREIHTYLYSIVPIIFLAIINALLLYQTVFSVKRFNLHGSRCSRKRNKTTTRSLIALTAIFFIFTSPNAIVGIFVPSLFKSTSGRNILFLCNNLGFSYHSLNILVFLFVNKQFKREVKKIINEIKSSSQNKKSNNNKNNNELYNVS